MKNEELEKIGLDEAQIKAVQKIHGLDIEAKKTEIAGQGAKIETLQNEADATKAQLAEANEAIDGLKELDAEGLKQSVADWQKKADEWKSEREQLEADAKTNLDKVKYDHALEKTLVDEYGVKAEHIVDVVHRLKNDDIKFSDDGFIGLKEQVAPMQENLTSFFSESDEVPQFTQRSKNKGKSISDGVGRNAAFRAAGIPVPKD